MQVIKAAFNYLCRLYQLLISYYKRFDVRHVKYLPVINECTLAERDFHIKNFVINADLFFRC
jgi:hypothetical protein